MVSKSDMIIFDMDGVLVDVHESYRETICVTVEHFTSKQITRELIQEYKNQGGWNNDWALSKKIASDLGVEVPYDKVVEYFNRIFFGENNDGLIMREQWFAALCLAADPTVGAAANWVPRTSTTTPADRPSRATIRARQRS